ncbi:hypothetical protein D307_gp080 [Bacillus phage Bastille]|uniref:Uncharacterized protein n=4 Tax=Bastillevirus TaxID=1918010 RepID=A0A024B023_9CAUD|nr:hypothetical protein D307_gp080 [Bacillus phage Bastille]YP_009035776.1 hypothetical protein FP76_gp115 [Bacillus phage Evoli]AMW62008.1 hypothetical protein DNAM5_264 [Bacillus phage Vinny]ASR79405.1 hypothetical protein OTK52_261 [Bacillus phage OTooleKemple52]ASR79775.1 hypothetical protein JANET_258 [Bacillus phage Janet]ASU01104.1 hypothetical protein ANTHONY_264 [Bacillus phage Anthony]AXQ67136.1 hypothetical protein KAMFAM_263 [Bacillus phage Kamfam]
MVKQDKQLLNWYIMCLTSLNQGDTLVIPDKYYSNLLCILHEMQLDRRLISVGFVNDSEVKVVLK